MYNHYYFNTQSFTHLSVQETRETREKSQTRITGNPRTRENGNFWVHNQSSWMLKWHFRVFGFAKKFPRKTMWLLDLFGSGSGNLKSQNLKSVPPCACFHGFFSRVLGFPVTMLHTLKRSLGSSKDEFFSCFLFPCHTVNKTQPCPPFISNWYLVWIISKMNVQFWKK